jgi:hypothetical protein
MNFLDYIKEGDAIKATALIEVVLKKKTLAYINEHKAEVTKSVYNKEDEEESK